ncbi:MAG: hypothetical protein WC785_11040 [Tatlockia sp.]|jgi:hypothetical protein
MHYRFWGLLDSCLAAEEDQKQIEKVEPSKEIDMSKPNIEQKPIQKNIEQQSALAKDNSTYVSELKAKYQSRVIFKTQFSAEVVNSFNIDCHLDDGRYIPLINALYWRLSQLDTEKAWLVNYVDSRDDEIRIYDYMQGLNGRINEPHVSFVINKWNELIPQGGLKLNFIYDKCFDDPRFGIWELPDQGTTTPYQKGTPPYQIGDNGPAGGKVFYVTDGGLHGLEAAPKDQSHDEARWGCIGTPITGADGTAVGTGAQNTVDILAGCNEPDRAAQIAHNYSLNGYTDWFLPSKDELHLLFNQQSVVGGFDNAHYWSGTDGYWSSSEVGASGVWIQTFKYEGQFIFDKNDVFRVRAIR